MMPLPRPAVTLGGCPWCGSAALPDEEHRCPACGKPRPYLPDPVIPENQFRSVRSSARSSR